MKEKITIFVVQVVNGLLRTILINLLKIKAIFESFKNSIKIELLWQKAV